MVYKIANKLDHIDNRCLKPSNRKTRLQRCNTFQIPASRANYRKFSVYLRTIADWNALPEKRPRFDTASALPFSSKKLWFVDTVL